MTSIFDHIVLGAHTVWCPWIQRAVGINKHACCSECGVKVRW
jgi:hypothetical protein